MSPAQLAAVSYLARYSGRTHDLYAYQLRRWFAWCEGNDLDPLVGIQRAHVELYIRQLGGSGLQDSSVVTMMHGVRGFFRFAHIDGTIASDPAVYARLPKVHRDESRTQGLDRLELIRFLQVAQTLRSITAPWRSCWASTRCVPPKLPRYGSRTTPRRCAATGCCTWSGRATSPPRCRSLCPSCGCWRPAEGSAPPVRWYCGRSPGTRSTGVMSIGWSPGSRRPPASRGTSAHTRCGMRRSPTPWTPASRSVTPRSSPATPTPHHRALRPARGNLDRHGVHFLTAYVAGV